MQYEPDKKSNSAASENKKDSREDSENVNAAHEQAEKDIRKDADLSIHSPNDDLDEGETARLGEDNNPIT